MTKAKWLDCHLILGISITCHHNAFMWRSHILHLGLVFQFPPSLTGIQDNWRSRMTLNINVSHIPNALFKLESFSHVLLAWEISRYYISFTAPQRLNKAEQKLAVDPPPTTICHRKTMYAAYSPMNIKFLTLLTCPYGVFVCGRRHVLNKISSENPG